MLRKERENNKKVKTFFLPFLLCFDQWVYLYVKQRVLFSPGYIPKRILKQEVEEMYRGIFPWCQCLLWCIQGSKVRTDSGSLRKGRLTIGKQRKNNKDFFVRENFKFCPNMLLINQFLNQDLKGIMFMPIPFVANYILFYIKVIRFPLWFWI